jgi:hypothetical protein
MKRMLLIFTLITVSSIANATDHFILASAQGNGSGTDWINACKDFSGSCAVNSLIRGDTYYVGTGTYTGNYTFNTPDSGTAVITILGATAANHGTDTGWSSSYSVNAADGGSQAVWSHGLTFTSDYWKWDGAVGAGASVNPGDMTPGDYGFRFADGLNTGVVIGTSGSGSCGSSNSNITLAHFYAKATSSDTQKDFEIGNTYGGVLSNITFSNFLIDGWQGLLMTKSGGCSNSPYTGWIVQYGIMLNGYSSSANHGEWIDPNERPISGLIFRYNIVRGSSGNAGMTGWIVANNSDNDNAEIYGNVFDSPLVGNGVITGTSQGKLNNASIYNNTFLNMPSQSGNALCGTGQGSGNIAQNNLFYKMSASVGSGCAADYNTYFSTTNTPSETHGQTASGSPFVNVSSFNYALTADTNAGAGLSGPSGCSSGATCFNIDPVGNTRGSDGVWDRGAYQLSSGSSNGGSVSPPTNLAAIAQ